MVLTMLVLCVQNINRKGGLVIQTLQEKAVFATRTLITQVTRKQPYHSPRLTSKSIFDPYCKINK